MAVYNWIKAFGEAAQEIRSDTQPEIVEIDEMHTYIGSKKTPAGSGLLLIDMGKGSSTAYWAGVTQPPGNNYGTSSKIGTSGRS